MGKAGRPLSKLDLPEGWQEEVVNLYSEGASDVEIKALICKWRGSMSNDLWERWMREEPIFSETINHGRSLSHAWWERNGRVHLQNKDFSYVGWYMNMKNRFKWADKQEIDHSNTDGTLAKQQDLTKLSLEELKVLKEINKKLKGE